MKRKYCDICQKSIVVKEELKQNYNDIKNNFKDLRKLYRKVDNIRGLTKSRGMTYLNPKEERGDKYYHNSPFLTIANNLLSFYNEDYFNIFFCPNHYREWFDYIKGQKKRSLENQEAFSELLKEKAYDDNEKEVLSLMVSVAPIIITKFDNLIGKLEALQEKNTLSLLESRDLWKKLKRNRVHKNLEKFSEYRELKFTPITPQIYYSNIPIKDLEKHNQIVEKDLYEHKTSYEKMIYDPILRNIYIFETAYGYYWINEEKKELSSNFFITYVECEKDLRKHNKYILDGE